MHIVQLAGFYAPTSGGLRVVVDTLGRYYVSAGHRRTLIVPGPADSRAAGEIELRAPRLPDGSGYRVIVRRRALLRELARLRPDRLEVHDKLMLRWVAPWARSMGIPIVAFTHERLQHTLPMFAPALAPAARRLAEAINRRVAADCDHLVACSRYAAAEFDGLRDVELIRLGVDTTQFRPHAVASRRRVRLVLASRLSVEKQPLVAVHALRRLVSAGIDAELTVLGTGPQRERVVEAARGLPVRMPGFVDRAQVAAIVGGADVALVPGPAETFGLAALEALACGTPIVCVAGGAVSELLAAHPAGGETAEPTAAAFAAAVRRVLARPAAERRSAARACASGRTWDATGAAVLSLHRAPRAGHPTGRLVPLPEAG